MVSVRFEKFVKNASKESTGFLVFLTKGEEITIEGNAHIKIIALTFGKDEKDKISEAESILNICTKANEGPKIDINGIHKPQRYFNIENISYSLKRPSSVFSLPSSKQVIELKNFTLSPQFYSLSYDGDNFNFVVEKSEYKKNESILILDVKKLEIKEAFTENLFPVKKIIFRNNSTKLTELNDIIKLNFDKGEKNFTLENVTVRPNIKKWEEMELDLNENFYSGIILKGKSTKPSNPLPENPPPGGPNGPTQNIPQLRTQAISDIQAELDKPPQVVDSELGQYSDWKNRINKLDSETEINALKSTLKSEIEKARTKKESGVEQAINNLTDENQKVKAKELWRKLIAGEKLVEEGNFDQQVYDPLSAEKEQNSNIYQIINQEGRLDKLLINLKRIKEGDNGSNNRQAQKNGNSALKLIIGGGAIVLVIFITAAVIWKSKKKKKKLQFSKLS